MLEETETLSADPATDSDARHGRAGRADLRGRPARALYRRGADPLLPRGCGGRVSGNRGNPPPAPAAPRPPVAATFWHVSALLPPAGLENEILSLSEAIWVASGRHPLEVAARGFTPTQFAYGVHRVQRVPATNAGAHHNTRRRWRCCRKPDAFDIVIHTRIWHRYLPCQGAGPSCQRLTARAASPICPPIRLWR